MSKTKDVLDVLVRLLSDEEAIKRSASAIVLAEVAPKDESVLEALRQAALRKDDPGLRRWIAIAIGEIAPKSIVADLQPLINDRDRRVRSAVKHVLATCKSVKEAEIARMLDGDDDGERLAAIAVLGAMGTVKARDRLLEKLPGAPSKVSGAIVDALRPSMEEGETKVVERVVEKLDHMLTPDAVESDPDLAIAGVQLLARSETEVATDVLLRLAKKGDEAVRVSALESMQRYLRGRQHKRRFEKLINIVSEESTPNVVRAAALNVLSNLEVPVPLEARVRSLATSERPGDRKWALTALGNVNTDPAAETLAAAVETGTPDDRTIALASAAGTSCGRAALAKLLGRITDTDRASAIAKTLRDHPEDLAPDTCHALEQSVMEAPPEIGRFILDVLKHAGGAAGKDLQGDLLNRAVILKNKRKYADAISMLRSLCQDKDADPEARFHLGVCELKTSKRKIARGPNNDPCLTTFGELLRVRDFPLLERITSDKIVEAEDLFYLGFSFAERKEKEQGFGGDLLMHLAEESKDKKVAGRAHNKLKTMGWVE